MSPGGGETVSKTALHWTLEIRRKQDRTIITWKPTIKTEMRGLGHSLSSLQKMVDRRGQIAVEVLCGHPVRQWARRAINDQLKLYNKFNCCYQEESLRTLHILVRILSTVMSVFPAFYISEVVFCQFWLVVSFDPIRTYTVINSSCYINISHIHW